MPALICGARPKVVKSGPIVRLEAGTWRFQRQNHSDTVLRVLLLEPPGSPVEFNGKPRPEVYLVNTTKVQVEITTGGSESYISVYAERVS